MDLSRLAYSIALALFIATYWPLVRRSGSHVNLWFLGWTLILLNNVYRMLLSPSGQPGTMLTWVLGTVIAQAGGFAFLMAASNRQRWIVGRELLLAMAAGPAAQDALFLLNDHAAALLMPATMALYFLPVAYVSTRKRRPSRPLLVVAAGFGIFGIATLSAHTHPYALRSGAMLLIYLSAAYLLLRTSRKVNRAILLTAAGLVAWGLRSPMLHVLFRLHPGFSVNRAMLHLPEVLVMAGSALAMLEERLRSAERLATHDPLTNLPNRRFLYERFAQALDRARASRTTLACLVIDVDNFKTINDTMGHAAGDELLRSLAIRLGWHISPRDVLARTGGDEFTVMLAGASNEHYLRFMAEAMMSAVSVPVQIAGTPVDVRISMGIALSPDDADEIDELIRLADEAMYRAKRRGGNVLAFAGDPEPARRAPAAHILQMGHPSRTAMQPRAAGADR